MKKITQYGPIFIITAALLWSFDGLLRTSLYQVPPTIVVFWEHLLGLILLTPFVIKNISDVKTLSKKEWGSILLVSLFSGALGTILYTAALGKVQYIQFSVVVLLQQLQPIWAVSAAAILLKEKLNKSFIFWAALAITASYLVTFKDLKINVTSGFETIIAALFALLAGMMWAVSTSFSKIVLNKISFTLTTYLRFGFAALFALIMTGLFNQLPLLTKLNTNQWTALIIITLSTGMVALLIYYFGLRKTPARVSAICELVWPASAIFIDYFYFHRTLSLTQILGVVIVLTSIYKISRFRK